nr:hypothetical protein HK105_000822 [Polyrhizophydium stewartii]
MSERELHCSLWDQSSVNDSDVSGFLGQIVIPLSTVMQKQRTDKWYWLNPMSSESALANASERKARARKRSLTEEEKRNRPRDLVKSLHKSEAMSAIRLRIKLVDTIVMPLENYSGLVTLLQENSYFVPVVLGKVSQDREDAARSLIRIFETNDSALRFLKAAVAHEISLAPDSRTLFRANSMASKAVDVFMKHVGSHYLKMTLEAPLLEIVQSGKTAELDPTRIERSEKDKPEKLERELQRNVTTLLRFNGTVIAGILESVDNMPTLLKDFFWFLQNTVTKKFEKDPVVRYTCISGFIFLRFFAPAVLGPKLFGLEVGTIDSRASRNLLLVAKTLQNLSNLVEFGQKEPFMAPMNVFIKDHLQGMKSFIEAISKKPMLNDRVMSTDDLAAMPSLHELLVSQPKESALVARECAELHGVLSQSLEKMRAAEPTHESIQQLGTVLFKLDERRQAMMLGMTDADLALVPWDSEEDLLAPGHEGDVPCDWADDDAQRKKEDDDERKIMRMLTRCSSSSIRSSLGSFRHSVDLRESMVKGHIKGEPVVPATIITVSSSPASSMANLPAQQPMTMDRLVRASAGGDAQEDAANRSADRIDDKSMQRLKVGEARMGRAGSDASIATSSTDRAKPKRESMSTRVATSFGFLNKLLFDSNGAAIEGGQGDAPPAQGANSAAGGATPEGGRPTINSQSSFRRKGPRESQTGAAHLSRVDSPSSARAATAANQAESPWLGSASVSMISGQQDDDDDEPETHTESLTWVSFLSEPPPDSPRLARSDTDKSATRAGSQQQHQQQQQQQRQTSNTDLSTQEYCDCEFSAELFTRPNFRESMPPQVMSPSAPIVINGGGGAAAAGSPSEAGAGGTPRMSHSPSLSIDSSVVGNMASSLVSDAEQIWNRNRQRSTSHGQESLCTKCGRRKSPVKREKSRVVPSVEVSPAQSATSAAATSPPSTVAASSASAAAVSSPSMSQRLLRGGRSQASPSSGSMPPTPVSSGAGSGGAGSGSTGSGTGSGSPSAPTSNRTRSATLSRRNGGGPPNLAQLMGPPICHRCSLEITEAMLEAEGKRYHPSCLCCASCKTPLTMSLIPFENDVVCRECYLRRTGLVCGVCRELIYAEYLVVNGVNFHKCGLALAGKEHFTLGDQVFCSEHRDTIITCHTCHQRIDGEVLIAGSPQRFYHLNHFGCSGCGKDLAATVFYEMNGRLWCQPCFLDHGEKSPMPADGTDAADAADAADAVEGAD